MEVVDITTEEDDESNIEEEGTIPLALVYRPTIHEIRRYRADLRYETWMTKKLVSVAWYKSDHPNFDSPRLASSNVMKIMIGFNSTYEILPFGSFLRPIKDRTNVLSNTIYMRETGSGFQPDLYVLPPGVHLPSIGITGRDTHFVAQYAQNAARAILTVHVLDDTDIFLCDSGEKKTKVRPATVSHEATHYQEDCFPDVLRRAMAKHVQSWSHRAREQDGQTGYMNVQPYVGNQRASTKRGYQVQTCFEGKKYFLGHYARTEVGVMVAIAARLDSSNLYNSSTAYEWVHRMVHTPNAAQDWVARVRPDLKSFKRKRFMMES